MPPPSTINALRATYCDRARDLGGLFLLSADDALDYIDEAIASEFELLGVEGFWLHEGGSIQPDQEFSNDIADWHGGQAEFVAATKEVVRKGAANGVWFEVWLNPNE